mgnify:CR=1 FL=1
MDLLSIIVPCYNEEESVENFLVEVQNVLKGRDFEVIFINDGSSDDTLKTIKGLADKTPNVKYISFSRNFGKEAAIYAGLNYAKGNLVCLMDADLQHPPSMLPEMIKAIEDEGYDVAAARRISRKGEPKIKSFFSHRYYRFFNRISKIEIVEGGTDYRVMTRQVIDSILELKEYNRFSKGLFQWVGFDTKWISFRTVDRQLGTTTWKFSSLFKFMCLSRERMTSMRYRTFSVYFHDMAKFLLI